MIIIEVFSDCIAQPIRLAYVLGDTFTDCTLVIVSDDEAVAEFPRYLLHVTCGKAYMDSVGFFQAFQDVAQAQGCSVALTQIVGAGVVEYELGVACSLPFQKLLLSSRVYQLDTDQVPTNPHGDS